MSTSTVSISANPSARRRPFLAGEKRTGVELAGDDAVAGVSVVRDDKVLSGKDPNHSIRSEAVLERSRDAVQAKKSLSAATAAAMPYARQTYRKAAAKPAKPEKPLWLTVLSVFTKNFLLLILLLGLFQMMRKLVSPSGNEVSFTTGAEIERRIDGVEGLLKKTTKMMHAQVELVDKRVDRELGGLRKDLDKKIEDKHVELATMLKKFDGRTEVLEKTLADLRAGDWLKREDFDRFVEDLKTGKGINGNGDVDLNEVRAVVREMVEKELDKHVADGLGRVDYALASGGAMVVRHSEQYGVRRGVWFNRLNRKGVHNSAVKMLSPSFGEPGQCFPLKGNAGFVQIMLKTAIIPEAVTLEHVAKTVAYDRSSAPKDCRISGWMQRHDSSGKTLDAEKMTLLTEFTYDLEKSNIQTFDVLDTPVIVDTIRFDFTSNHGNPAYTCIYRLRVHGHEPDSLSMSSLS